MTAKTSKKSVSMEEVLQLPSDANSLTSLGWSLLIGEKTRQYALKELMFKGKIEDVRVDKTGCIKIEFCSGVLCSYFHNIVKDFVHIRKGTFATVRGYVHSVEKDFFDDGIIVELRRCTLVDYEGKEFHD